MRGFPGSLSPHGISEKSAIWIDVFQSHGALSILDDLTCAKHGHIQWQCFYTLYLLDPRLQNLTLFGPSGNA